MNTQMQASHSDSLLYSETHYESVQEQEKMRATYSQSIIDLKQYEIIETIARVVHASLDISEICHKLIEALNTYFSPIAIYIYIAQPEHRRLKLLQYSSVDEHSSVSPMSYIPYDDQYWLSSAYQQHKPIINRVLSQTHDKHSPETNSLTSLPDSHSYINLPLWCNNHFEGTLTLVLACPLIYNSIEIQTLIQCSNHIATALAHARLYAEKDNFLSLASHELRTPITAIQGFAELLQMRLQQGDLLDTPRSMRALTSIIHHSEHLTHLLEDMLDLSCIENDHFYVKATMHDLVPILMQVVETQKLHTRQHNIYIILDGLRAIDTLPANIDYDRMIQVLNNLLNNAIKYSPLGGNIEVGIRRETLDQKGIEHCLIWVKDHGLGIEAQELPHIFERFYRARSLNHSIKGAGIGLYLVKELITRHQGRVWAESEPGQGSTFYIQLPLSQQSM